MNEKTLNTEKNLSIKIDYRFKLLYSIAMMSVIAEHCRGLGSIELNMQGWFHYSSYHMPLFMFAAGYFFKQNNVNNTFKYINNKFKKLIIPIFIYNFFYGFYIQILKKLKFKNHTRPFSFKILFLEPFIGSGFKHITPSWFSSTLFYVEAYNILKRKIFLTLFKSDLNELLYFIIDFIISYYTVYYSNKGYNNKIIYIAILRTMHLNIYYQLGIFYKKTLEKYIQKIKNDIYFVIIFITKLLIHLYYGREIAFYYGLSNYYKTGPLAVIFISFLGIFFWMRFCEIFEPILGKNFYINIIADNTYSIMINHSLSQDIIRIIFFFISKYTKYCKNFDKKKFFNMDHRYIYIPNNKIRQIGIIYFLNCFFFSIILQKIIDKVKIFIKKNLNLKEKQKKI